MAERTRDLTPNLTRLLPISTGKIDTKLYIPCSGELVLRLFPVTQATSEAVISGSLRFASRFSTRIGFVRGQNSSSQRWVRFAVGDRLGEVQVETHHVEDARMQGDWKVPVKQTEGYVGNQARFALQSISDLVREMTAGSWRQNSPTQLLLQNS